MIEYRVESEPSSGSSAAAPATFGRGSVGMIDSTIEELREALRKAQHYADFRTVERLARELAARCRNAGDGAGEGNAYAYLGGALVARNAGREAREAYARSRELFDGARDLVGTTRALNGLAVVAMDIDLDAAEARRWIDEALRFARVAGERRLLGVVLGNLCEVQRLEGDFNAALQSARSALAIMIELDDPARAAWQLVNVAHCQLLARNRSGAIATMQEAKAYVARGRYDSRIVAWYFDVWFILLAGAREWAAAARVLGFVNHFRAENGLVRLQLMLPWLSAPTENLWRELPADTVVELMHAGEALSVEETDALIEAVPFE